MTIGEIITLIKDLLVVGGVAYILLFIHQADKNALTVKDLEGVQQQIAANAVVTQRWAEEASNARTQQQQDMQTVATAINAQQRPVYVLRNPGGTSTVPGGAGGSAACPAEAGGGNAVDRINIRPAVNAAELKIEGWLAGCRAALASWPH